MRMARADGDIVEKAEAHRRRTPGVMAGRTRATKAVSAVAAHHLVDSGDGAADRVQRRFERPGAHQRIGVERGIRPSRGCGLFDARAR